MRLTDTQRDVLLRMTDGEWYLGADLTASGNVLSRLIDKGLIRYAGEDAGFINDRYTITPDGGKVVGVVV